MVVVAIMALLIGILLPALSKARQHAKSVASSAVLSAIGTGLEMFKAEGNLGGDYPPSFSDADGTAGYQRGDVADPYKQGGGASFPIRQMSGAGLLVWGLAGADQLGTPGFKVFRTSGSAPSTFWCQDTDKAPQDATDRTASGAYALDADDRPIQPRSGPYVDLSKIQITQYKVTNDGQRGFFIDAETNARGDHPRPYPLFLDTFGFPILYWKADPAGNRIVDQRRDQFTGPARGIYHWEDNWALLDRDASVAGIDPLVLHEPSDSELHWDGAWAPDLYDADPTTGEELPPDKTFANFIMNPKTTAKLTPFRPDSYLLISPGYDGVYGTGDDVTNFR
jgi:type II secretory pathway pseudopilin PulG